MAGQDYNYEGGYAYSDDYPSYSSDYSYDSNSSDYGHNNTFGGNSSFNGHGTEPPFYPEDYGFHGQDYTEFVYEAFEFERPIYLYIWEILVVVTFLVNILVIWVLLHKKMQSVTNLILVAIAISDSMTGLVTLPSYIMVYTTKHTDTDNPINMTEYEYMYDGYEYVYTGMDYTGSLENYTYPESPIEERDAYILSKSLCQAFMLSKFFLSKSFHTISIWLTLFLGVQRYISVAYPFKTQVWFTTRNTIILCVTFAFLAPILHLYHLVNDKTENGFCSWQLKQGSVGDAVHLWMTLLLRHVIPCALLTITTILFVNHLNKNPFNGRKSTSTRVFSGNEVRADENRRVSKIVIAIVIVFLIPEVPYAIFLLFTTIVRHTNANHLSDLKRNRAFHAGYEITLVLSYHLNFYIYTFFNRRFRRQLKKMCACFGVHVRSMSISSRLASISGRRTLGGSTKNESLSNTGDSKGTEMKSLNHSSDSQNTDKTNVPNTVNA